MIGKTVGKYRILDRLGRGGMGTVYRAVDATLDREVAIKVLNPAVGDHDVLTRFRAEAVTLARLNHPGIATIYELCRQDDELLMVMELVRGETLHEMAQRVGTFAIPQAAHVCMQVLDALAYAHRAGIVHRDLTPSNVMITETGVVKVMDFGIARVLGSAHVTQTGALIGTPAYMAPEQVLGDEVDGRADLYAVGVVLYRLLAGELPFRADTALSMVHQQIHEPPIPIATRRPDVPPWCASVIERALAKSRSDRFQSAEAFRSALAAKVKPEPLGELPTRAMRNPAGLLAPGDPTAHGLGGVPAAGSDSAANPAIPAGAATPTSTPAIAPGRPATTVVLGWTHLVTLGALVAVLAVGVVILAFVALRRGTVPEQVPAPGAPVGVPLPAPSGPGGSRGAASEPPGTSRGVSAPEPGVPQARPVPVPPAQTKVGPPGVRTPGTGRAIGTAPSSVAVGRTPEPPPPPIDAGRAGIPPAPGIPPGNAEPAPSASRTLPLEPAIPFVVTDIRVMTPATPTGELAVDLNLGGGRIAVLEHGGSRVLRAIPYAEVTSAFFSRSPLPRWRNAEGREFGGRGLGRRGANQAESHAWLVVVTKGNQPLAVKLDDDTAVRVVMAVQTRTGVVVQRYQPR